jgi:hypothetical protein
MEGLWVYNPMIRLGHSLVFANRPSGLCQSNSRFGRDGKRFATLHDANRVLSGSCRLTGKFETQSPEAVPLTGKERAPTLLSKIGESL